MRRHALTIVAVIVGTGIGAGAGASELAAILRQGLDIVSPSARAQLAPTVAGWIEELRDGAVARGVETMPAEVRDELRGFFPDDLLESVRWRVDGESGMTGPGFFRLSSAHAITLDNVILFGSAEEAADVGLWAHEVYHVLQYRQWGIEGFVARYLADHGSVEHEAKEFRYQWWKATRWTGG